MKNSLIKIALLFSFQFIHLHAKHVDESIKIIPLKYYYDIFNGYSNDYGSSHVYDDISGCYSGYSYSQYQPDKKDCNRFFVCNPQYRKRVHDQPMALVGVCPPEMWFDANHSDEDRVVCTHFKIICASEYTDMYDYCDCKAINHAMDKVGAQQANTEAEEFSNEESITCIVDNEFHLFESVKDCEKYYVCFNTKVFPMQCKPGLHFNPITKYCDSPEVTGCKLLDRDCPPSGISLLRHPYNCNAFYHCYYGKKTLQACDFYHMWDDKTKTCVRQDQTTCISSGKH